jgi:hypothetical protein
VRETEFERNVETSKKEKIGKRKGKIGSFD